MIFDNNENTESFDFDIQGTIVTIRVEKGPLNQLIVPLDKPIEGISCAFQRDEFIETIQSLLPKTLNGNILQEVKQGLANTIQNHIYKYGELSLPDIHGYISRTMLIMRAISPMVKMQPISKEDGIQIFAMFEQMIINALPKDYVDGL